MENPPSGSKNGPIYRCWLESTSDEKQTLLGTRYEVSLFALFGTKTANLFSTRFITRWCPWNRGFWWLMSWNRLSGYLLYGNRIGIYWKSKLIDGPHITIDINSSCRSSIRYLKIAAVLTVDDADADRTDSSCKTASGGIWRRVRAATSRSTAHAR